MGKATDSRSLDPTKAARLFRVRLPWIFPILCLAVFACKEPSAEKEVASPKAKSSEMRWLRVEVVVEKYDKVPFFLGVRTGDSIALIDNGEDQVKLQAEVSETEIYARFPVFGTELLLEKNGDVWTGEWLASYRLKRDFPLQAKQVDAPSPQARFPATSPAAANMAGQWRVDIEGFGIGRAVFRQDESGTLDGSLVPPEVGDTRYMSGKVSGTDFAMSTFDGIHAYLLQGTISENGNRLTGKWSWPGVNSWNFVATRGDQPSVASLVSAKLRSGATHVTLPELQGYRGKPVLVDFFGTWCPACMDLTPQLVRLHEKYKGDGLVMLSIAIEPPGNGKATERRIAEYRERYGVTWDIAVRYVEDYTDVIPPEIENALGFPVTIFVRRDQSVAGVHTAFVSDAARPEHKAILDRFDEWAQEIVASPDGTVASPDGTVESPDGKVDSPDGKVDSPDGKAVPPDRKVASPDPKVASPDSKVASPDSKVASPDRKVASPDRKVASPDPKVAPPDRN